MYELRLQKACKKFKEASAEFELQRSHTIGRLNPNRDAAYFKTIICTLEWHLPSGYKTKHRITSFPCVVVVTTVLHPTSKWKDRRRCPGSKNAGNPLKNPLLSFADDKDFTVIYYSGENAPDFRIFLENDFEYKHE